MDFKKKKVSFWEKPIKPEERKKVAIFFTVLISLIIILAIMAGFKDDEAVTEKTQSKPKKQVIQKTKELKADIMITKGVLNLTNKNDFKWTPSDGFYGYGVIFRLNDDFKYFYRVPLHPGESIHVPLTDFTKKEVRFNIFTYKPKNYK